MASHNANGIRGGNDDSSRGAYSGRYRNRQHPRGNERRPNFSNNHPSSVSGHNSTEGQHTQEIGDTVPNTEGSISATTPKPRRGRGFAGATRNAYRKQPQSHHQVADNNPRQGYTLRGDSYYAHDLGSPSRNALSQDVRQHIQNVNFHEIQTRNPQNLSEIDSAQASGGASYVDGRANQMETSYTERGASSRPKQARGSRKPFRPQYTKDYVEREGSGRTSAASYNNSYPPDYVSTSISSTSASLEHQPFENIRREYSKYKSRPPFEAQYEGRGDSRSTHEKYRRDERSGGYGSQERFPKGESTVNYAPRDRYGSEEPRVSTSSSKEQSSFNKPSRIYDSQNWRSEGFKKGISARTQKVSEAMADTAMQRERLTTQLTSGTYECMVCCESVKPVQPIWNCSQCFHAFHLGCVRRWSRTSQDESGHWRCPGCQSVSTSLPNFYLCFCSKRKDPEWNRRETPHSCGEVCGKALGDGISCTHSCTLLCHPGPCPICSAQTQRKCPCGKSSQLVKCGSSNALLCGELCGKQLSCELHTCQEACHIGPCEQCPLTVQQDCFCGQSNRELPCSVEHPEDEKFSCDLVCNKKLSCGRHSCQRQCHVGDCGACQLEVDTVVTCPCGKVQLKQLYKTKGVTERKFCTDPIPVCGKVCGKIMSCGPAENPHVCAVLCHGGLCPPCPLSTDLRCRCGRNEKKFPCRKLSEIEEVLCERRCNKKRQCGRHKCTQVCCVDTEHICPMVCGRTLSCGLHRCEALCHAGNCNRCHQVSFDELRCHCGTQVVYPPVPCGTRPPDCNKTCTRVRACGHPPSHNCHPDANGCPPCTTLCEKFCYGKHEKRKNIPCHLTEVSCGKPCGRPMKCGKHTCPVVCHPGPCPSTCTQPCPVLRTDCDHTCGLPCHEGNCPVTPCREKIKVQCQCGQRTATVSCEENELSYRKMATGLLASKMAQLQSGECVDLKDLLGKSAANKTKSLECNEECALVERNRRLALALQIKNPNPKPGAPPYPDILKEWAKKDQRFVQMVHDKLTELVQLAKQSVGKMKSRSHSFDSMNRDKRQFIHEYCVFFGCESMSYDDEPKRNVVATAFGELSFLPAISILDVTRRELGQRKMPAPPRGLTVLTSGQQQQQQQQQVPQPPQKPPNAWGSGGSAAPFRTLSDVVKSTPAPNNATESPAPDKTSQDPKPPVVDYFDFTS